MQLGIFAYDLAFLLSHGYVIPAHISGKHVSSNFNINVLQKMVFAVLYVTCNN